ncbi:MAG TPA: pantoate--beta-alanine ligase [Clostridia bacterium]|nr:pantoate--beta-alanine ligase [Clostridia bacterium]
MLILRKIAEVRQWVQEKKKQGLRVGLVPTMGYLHEGHLSLVRAARQENDLVVMSIFVNPLQFGPREDFATYPRDLARDADLAERAGVDMIFAPEGEEMYPYYPQDTTVQVARLAEGLCGVSRPGHFTGVATVVTKLFMIVLPERAYFGQKDYQQFLVIKRMAADLNMPIEVRMVPIKREADGLAMSSRNTYLSAEERRQAVCLVAALRLCKERFEQGENNSERLIKAMTARINREPAAQIDYIKICDADTLEEMSRIDRPVVVALAVYIGKTRLIDNMLLNTDVMKNV